MILSDNGRAIVFMMFAMAGFILNDSCVKLVSSDLPLGEIMFLRGAMALSLLLVWCVANGTIKRFPLLLNRLVGLRVFAEVSATLLYLTALFNMPIPNATAILQALPLLVTAGAALFLGAPVGWRRWTAITIGFGGVLLIVRPGMEGFDAWALVALAGVFLMALRDLTTSVLPKNIPTLGVTFATLVGVTVTGLGLSVTETWVMPSAKNLLLLATAAGFILVGFVCIINAMRIGDISLVAPFRYSIILWAIVIGYLVWEDIPDTFTLAGIAVLVGTGIYSLARERKLLSGAGPAAQADLPR
ncbi:DMT family transporter [Stappia sp. MMSF_3263]|uniref:DMT family transporter n=1 Tax=Stappia sp. MMSF_3263 TaxID=3046693 RepID=UPI00273D867B|nr:DMT family transporter [Stappia sp. MMSF_3263]